MKRRRSLMGGTSRIAVFLAVLPVLILSQTYDAVPIGRPFLRPPPSPRQEPEPQIARGYQPPPRPSHFEPPRSYPSFQQPSLNLDNRPRPFVSQGRMNWQMQQLQQQHPQRFQVPVPGPRVVPQLPSLPHSHFRAGAPGQVPQVPRFNNPSKILIPTSTLRKQTQVEVSPADIGNGAPVDPVNNIIIHLYLNSKDRMSHAEIKTPVHGLFGIGTSHGGPGSHSDPIVITKDFDRDTLEFVEEGQAAQNPNSPSNIIEVKATVSTPNRQLENTVNKAVNQELDKAIPKVMDRMRGSTMRMDNGMRKELEEALVDELAKNLGETIDNTDITEDDLSKLIEEGFEEATKEETTTKRPIPPVTVVVTRPTTTTTTTSTTTTTTRRPIRTTTTTTTERPTTSQRTTTPSTTTTEWTNLVTEASNDDDYFTEESEDISQTTQPPPTTTTRRVVVITSPSTTTTQVWTRPTQPPTTTTTSTTTTTVAPTTTETVTVPPTTRTTSGHVHVVPGIRVTETTAPPPPSATTTVYRAPTTAKTTTTTISPPAYHPPTSIVTFGPDSSEEPLVTVPVPTAASRPEISTLPTRKPLIEVPASAIPHRGVVSLESNEEEVDYTKTVTSEPFSMYTTESLHNLPTKSGPTLHPSTFSPPLVTEPFTSPSTTTQPTTSTLTYSTPKLFSEPSTVSTVSLEDLSTFYESSQGTTVPQKTTKVEVIPHSKYTEEPFFSTSSIEWNPTSEGPQDEGDAPFFTNNPNLIEESTTTVIPPPSVIIMDEDYDYTNEFAVPVTTSTTTIASTSTPTTTQLDTKPKPITSSEEIQPNVVVQTGPCPTPNQPWDRNKTDVLFLLDSSDAFNEEKFHRAIDLIGQTVKQFDNFGPDGVQVSLVQYNDEPYLEFSLRKHNCKKHLLDDIADTEYMTGGSQLGKALEKVTQFAFTKKRGDRVDAENVLIIVTDGQSTDKVQQPTRLVNENNVTVLVISTLEADKSYVKELAGNKENNLFGMDIEQDLAWKLAKRIGEASGAQKQGPGNGGPIGSLKPVNPGQDLTNPIDQEPSRKPAPVIENDGIVHLECVGDGFKIKVSPPEGFRGIAVVKGYQDDARCKATATSSSGTVNLFISNEECGVTQVKSMDPKGLNSSLVLHLLHDKELNTGEDRAYLLQCFIGTPQEDTELSTNLDVIKTELAIAETISLSTFPPTCTYSIRKENPDGPIVTKALVGQTVYHRWDCDGSNETTNAYGIQVHSCYASDDVERKFAFVDPRGCSSDLALLTDLTYADDSLTAWAASHVFSVHNAESLKFVCKLSLCTRDGDGCEGVTPPACGNTNKTGLLLTKRLTKGPNSVDEALTSALTTKVGVSSRSVDGFEGVLASLASSYLFWIIAIVAVVAIVAISILSRNISESSETATTCSDPTSLSDSQDFGSVRSPSEMSMHSGAVAPPNERLADFMRTFDRNRYV